MATAAPAPKVNHIGLPVLEYRGGKIDALRRLRTQRDLGAHYRRDVPDGRGAGTGDEDERHRLLVEEPGLLHEPRAQLQQRARAHAVGFDGRDPGQPHDDDAGRLRRRRYGIDRHGAVCAPAAPQSADDLHHRRQRRVWIDQGPVLSDGRSGLEAEDRRDQRSAGHRHLRAGDSVGRDVRGPVVLAATRSNCCPC